MLSNADSRRASMHVGNEKGPRRTPVPFTDDVDESELYHSLSPAVAAVADTAPCLSVFTPEYTQSV